MISMKDFRKNRFLIFVSLIIIILLTISLISIKPHQIERDEYFIKAKALLNDVMEGLVKVRGLVFTNTVDLQVVSIEWVKENWGRKFVEETSREVMIEEEIYKLLFLIPEDTSLKNIRIEQSEWILAATIGHEIYIVRDYFELVNEFKAREIFAHELTHVLQSMHFKQPKIKFHDEKQAWNSLIEGDAILTAEMYMKFLNFSLSFKNSSKNFKDPLIEIWLFPYNYGKKFVKRVFEDQGWIGVNNLYLRVPKSTTEIMHPDKYMQAWRFYEVDLDSIKVEGWDQVKVERFGEHFIFVVLGTHIPIEIAAKAAEGWIGDKFIYYKKGSDYLFLWRILWESENDSDEFEESFNRLMSVLNGIELSQNYWKMPKQYIYLMKRGSEVLIISSSIELKRLLNELSIQEMMNSIIFNILIEDG